MNDSGLVAGYDFSRAERAAIAGRALALRGFRRRSNHLFRISIARKPDVKSFIEGVQMQSISAAPTSTATPPTPQPRLVRAAHEFEAQMMKELMKPLIQHDTLTGSEDGADEDSGPGGALGEFASEALGRALSEHGGFGIASSIVKQLTHSKDEASAAQNGTLPVIGNLHMKNVIKAAE